MSSLSSGSLPTTKISKSVTLSYKLHRSFSSSWRTFSSANSTKLLNSSNASSISSSPKLFRPVMQWQSVKVRKVVDAPASVAYKLYEDREMFPKWMPFLSSVEEMEGRPDVSRYLVKLESFGQHIDCHFLAKNLQSIPDRKLHWRSVEGFANRGSVEFFPRGPSSCLVEINFSFEVPHALVPFAFLMKPFMENLIRGGLERFATFVKTI